MPPEHGSLGEVLRDVARHPGRELIRKWNYKSALTSSSIRGTLFFVTNVTAGLAAAAGALTAEFLFRFATAGFYGAITQAFRRVEPARVGTAAALVVLPLLAHSLEWLVHWSRGTPNLALSISVSIVLTVFSTAFNLFAMREGALIVGEADSQPLWSDLRRLPRLLWRFITRVIAGIRALPAAWTTVAGA